jgi:thiamine-monophosphate kinase
LRDLIESHPVNRRILSRIGDDAAVWQPSRSHRSVITTDVLVENRHFRLDTMSLHDVGWRAMASNISDLAAMGARPLLCTVALGLPAGCAFEAIVKLYEGMLAVATRHGCAIVGGDVTSADALFVSIAAVGEVRPSRIKGRAGARPGDLAVVTGPLGASRAGLHLADNPTVLSDDLRDEALRAHRNPEPRVAEGRWLAASANVYAMMDVSDGISTDLTRMCAASNCAAVVADVPIAPSARAMAAKRGEDALAYALAGGEDFELLAAVDARAFGYIGRRFEKRFGHPLYAVGRFREGSGVRLRKGDLEVPLEPTGWDHLK